MDTCESTLLDFIQTPVFVLEPDALGRPVFVAFNEAAGRAAKVKVEQVLGLTAEDIYDGEMGSIIYQRHVSVLGSGQESHFELEFPIDGRLRHLRTHLQPVLSSGGAVNRIIGTVKDVTAEYELREERRRLQAATIELEAFISLAAHDLRSPIRNVKGLASMLMDGFEDLGDGKLQVIEKLDQVANKALLLISDILNHAEATGATESIETFALEPLCGDILAMLDPAGRHVATVDARLVDADKTAIQIVLRNLIDNAFKHNTGKPISLQVTVRKLYEGFLQFAVSDDGVGLDDSALQFLNGAEQRAGNSYGLVGVRNLLMSRGGSLNAETRALGTGALIRFSLPGRLIGS